MRTKRKIHKKKRSYKRRYRKQRGSGRQKVLINFADKGYENSRKSQKESATTLGNIDKVIEYSLNDMDQQFKDENKEILSESRGAGYWLWKPYFILKTLNTLNDGDILIYCDTAMQFVSSIDKYIGAMKSSIMLFEHNVEYIEKQFTKGDIFKELDAFDPVITDSVQLDASHSLWKKDANSIAFVTEWLNLCKVKQLIGDDPSITPNLPGFAENRHDQSLLSVLAKVKKDQYNIQIEKSATDYGGNTGNANLPVLLHHHRNRN